MIDAHQRKPHWSFWLIAVLAVVWNAGGAFDYIMCQFEVAFYIDAAAEASPEAAAWLAEMPSWRVGLWAFGVWGGMAGAVLLLVRRSLSIVVYQISIAAIVIGLIADFAVLGVGSLYAGGQGAMIAIILVLSFVQLFYAVRQRRVGVLS